MQVAASLGPVEIHRVLGSGRALRRLGSLAGSGGADVVTAAALLPHGAHLIVALGTFAQVLFVYRVHLGDLALLPSLGPDHSVSLPLPK